MQPSDPDDWFGNAGPEERPTSDAEPTGAAAPADDDWLDDEPRVVARRGRPAMPAWLDRRVVVVAASVVVLLIAGLAAGGVFSSGGGNDANVLPTTTTPTTTRAATTTPAPAAPSLPVPTGPLKPGDSGTQVTRLQRALARLGFSPGKADGSYGPSTTDAVKRFQQSKGLSADGICGSKTIAALETALRGA